MCFDVPFLRIPPKIRKRFRLGVTVAALPVLFEVDRDRGGTILHSLVTVRCISQIMIEKPCGISNESGTTICSWYAFLGSCLHLELLHGLLGLGNVDPIVVAAHLDSLLTFFFGKDTGFHGKSAFSFRNHSFSRIPNQIQVKVRKSLQILTVSVFYLAEWNFLPQALLRDMP